MKNLFSKKKSQPLPRVISVTKRKNRLDFLTTRIVLRFMGLVAFVIVLCLASIWTRIQVVGLVYDINALKAERETLWDENKRLLIELSLLKSPSRLQKIFSETGGLVLPDREHIVRWEVSP